MEKTLVIFKPDALNRGVVGEILHRFERKGLKLVGLKMTHLDDNLLDQHYEEHLNKPFITTLKDFMKRDPSILCVFEGIDVVEIVRRMAGSKYVLEGEPGTIRGDYSTSLTYTIIHTSASIEEAEKEIAIYFTDEELYSYSRVDESYIYTDEELNWGKHKRREGNY